MGGELRLHRFDRRANRGFAGKPDWPGRGNRTQAGRIIILKLGRVGSQLKGPTYVAKYYSWMRWRTSPGCFAALEVGSLSAEGSIRIPPMCWTVLLVRFGGFILQAGFGGFAVYLLGAASPLQAASIGFAGPEFLTRFLTATAQKLPIDSKKAPATGVAMQKLETVSRAGHFNGLMQWWSI